MTLLLILINTNSASTQLPNSSNHYITFILALPYPASLRFGNGSDECNGNEYDSSGHDSIKVVHAITLEIQGIPFCRNSFHL